MGLIYLDVYIGYVSHHIVLIVDDGQGGDTLVIHQLESILKGLIATAGPARQHLPMHTVDPKRRT